MQDGRGVGNSNNNKAPDFDVWVQEKKNNLWKEFYILCNSVWNEWNSNLSLFLINHHQPLLGLIKSGGISFLRKYSNTEGLACLYQQYERERRAIISSTTNSSSTTSSPSLNDMLTNQDPSSLLSYKSSIDPKALLMVMGCGESWNEDTIQLISCSAYISNEIGEDNLMDFKRGLNEKKDPFTLLEQIIDAFITDPNPSLQIQRTNFIRIFVKKMNAISSIEQSLKDILNTLSRPPQPPISPSPPSSASSLFLFSPSLSSSSSSSSSPASSSSQPISSSSSSTSKILSWKKIRESFLFAFSSPGGGIGGEIGGGDNILKERQFNYFNLSLVCESFRQIITSYYYFIRNISILLTFLSRYNTQCGIGVQESYRINSLYIPKCFSLLNIYFPLFQIETSSTILTPYQGSITDQLSHLNIGFGGSYKKPQQSLGSVFFQFAINSLTRVSLELYSSTDLIDSMPYTMLHFIIYQRDSILCLKPGVHVNEQLAHLNLLNKIIDETKSVSFITEYLRLFLSPEGITSPDQDRNCSGIIAFLAGKCYTLLRDSKSSESLFSKSAFFFDGEVAKRFFLGLGLFKSLAEDERMQEYDEFLENEPNNQLHLQHQQQQQPIRDEINQQNVVDYYLWVVGFSERYKATPESILNLCYCALNSCSSSPYLLQSQAILWSIIFKECLLLKNYSQAFLAIISNPDLQRKSECIERFVVGLCEDGEEKAICKLPFSGRVQDVSVLKLIDRTLSLKARTINPLIFIDNSSKSHNYWHTLYAFHISHSNYRQAALTMYEFCQRLKSEILSKRLGFESREKFLKSLYLQANCLLAVINALTLVTTNFQWILVPSSIDLSITKEPPQILSTSEDPANVIVKSLSDIQKEYRLLSAHIELLETSSMEITTLESAKESLQLLVSRGLYESAFSVGKLFDLDLSSIFIDLTRNALEMNQQIRKPNINNSTEEEEEDFQKSQHEVVKIWKIIERYLARYDSRETNFQYHYCVLNFVFQSSTMKDENSDEFVSSYVPAYILQSLENKYPAMLLRLFIKYRLKKEAVRLVREGIKDATIELKQETSRNSSLTYVYYNGIDQLKKICNENSFKDISISFDKYFNDMQKVQEDIKTDY